MLPSMLEKDRKQAGWSVGQAACAPRRGGAGDIKRVEIRGSCEATVEVRILG
jgi:hypothetical protein